MSFIVLTKAQADSVRGETTKWHALQPIEQKDGTFILPDSVLTDPAHASKFDTLKVMPTKQTADNKVIVESP